MIKIAAEDLKIHIATVFNYAINQGFSPNNLKIALIHPVHKGKSKMKNYV